MQNSRRLCSEVVISPTYRSVRPSPCRAEWFKDWRTPSENRSVHVVLDVGDVLGISQPEPVPAPTKEIEGKKKLRRQETQAKKTQKRWEGEKPAAVCDRLNLDGHGRSPT